MIRKQIIAFLLLAAPFVGTAAGPEVIEPLKKGNQEQISSKDYRERVLNYSLTLRESSEQTESVRQAMRQAKTSYLPNLDFSASGQYRVTDYDLDMMGSKVSMKPESYTLAADVYEVLYGGGGVREGYRSAKIQHQIASENEALTRSNVIYSAELNYWTTAAKAALWKLTNRYVQLIEEQINVIRDRFEDGLISKTDLLQIEGRLASAKIQRSEAYKSYLLSLQNLNIMMGCEPLNPVSTSEAISREDEIPQSVMSLEAALDRRSEYAISEYNVDFQRSQLKLNRSKFLPKLTVGMKAGWGTTMLNFDGSTMWNSYVYASLNVPIFHWGAKYKNVASQKAVLRSKEFAVQRVRDQISKELYEAYTKLVEYDKQIDMAEEACETTKESLELNTFSYNEGKLPIVDVLSAQVAWVQSRSALIQAWLQEKIAFADYNKAIGQQ